MAGETQPHTPSSQMSFLPFIYLHKPLLVLVCSPYSPIKSALYVCLSAVSSSLWTSLLSIVLLLVLFLSLSIPILVSFFLPSLLHFSLFCSFLFLFPFQLISSFTSFCFLFSIFSWFHFCSFTFSFTSHLRFLLSFFPSPIFLVLFLTLPFHTYFRFLLSAFPLIFSLTYLLVLFLSLSIPIFLSFSSFCCFLFTTLPSLPLSFSSPASSLPPFFSFSLLLSLFSTFFLSVPSRATSQKLHNKCVFSIIFRFL